MQQSLQLLARGGNATANIKEQKLATARPVLVRPGNQPLFLAFEIRLLSVPTDPCVQDEEPIIRFAQETFDLGPRDTRFQTDTHRLQFALLDPATHGQRMQAKFS